jgi:hypothetical protein
MRMMPAAYHPPIRFDHFGRSEYQMRCRPSPGVSRTLEK